MLAHSPKKSDSFTGVSSTSQQIFFISNGIRKRKIYHNVNYTETQHQWIKAARKALKKEKNLEIEEDAVILRYYYSADLSLEKCIQRLVKYNQWFGNPEIQTVTDHTNQIFKEGFIYSYSKAKDGRAFVIMNLGVFDLDKHSLMNYYQAINHVLNRVIAQQFMPGYIEDYVLILDLDEKLLGLPLSSLGDIIKMIGNAYSMFLGKMLVVNSTMLSKWLYNRVKSFIAEETARKITFFTHDDLVQGQLKEFIDEEVLEFKYGGSMQNVNHRRQFNQKEKLKRVEDHLNQTLYFSIEENQEYFKEAQTASCCAVEQCIIY